MLLKVYYKVMPTYFYSTVFVFLIFFYRVFRNGWMYKSRVY